MGGLVGRFAFVFGVRRHSNIAIPGAISRATSDRVEALFRSIAATPVRNGDFIRFSHSARVMFEGAFKRHLERMERLKFANEMGTYHARWNVRVFKLAMLFEILSIENWPLATSSLVVRDHSLIAAVGLCGILDAGFHRLFEGQFEREGEELSRDGKIQSRILKFVAMNSNSEGVSQSEIYRFIQERSRIVMENIDSLLDARRLVRRLVKTKTRSKHVYFLPKEKEIDHAPVIVEPEKSPVVRPEPVDGRDPGEHRNDVEVVPENEPAAADPVGVGGGMSDDGLRAPVVGEEGTDPGIFEGEGGEMDSFNPA
jgi:hypothetical protein